jgi:hypothetical protein
MGGRKYIFVGGVHRSGTSLVASCLAGHSMVGGFTNTGTQQDEGQFLQNVYPNVNQLGGAGMFSFHGAAHMTESADWLTQDNIKNLRDSWERMWPEDKSCVVEKTPQNLIMARAIQEVYSDAMFVFVLRHPIVNALAVRKWSHSSMTSLAIHWLRCHNWLVEDLPKIKNYIIVNYEDFVSRPQEICDIIWERSGFASEKVNNRVTTNSNASYESKWKEIQSRSRLKLDGQELDQNTLPIDYRVRLAYSRRVIKYLVRPFWGADVELTFGHREYETLRIEFAKEFERFGYKFDDLLGFSSSQIL